MKRWKFCLLACLMACSLVVFSACGGTEQQPSGDQPSGNQPSGDDPTDQPSGDDPTGDDPSDQPAVRPSRTLAAFPSADATLEVGSRG